MQKTYPQPYKTAIVYTQSNCTACEKAKYMLEFAGYVIESRVLDHNPAVKKMLVEDFPDARSVPQIIADGQRVGNLHMLADYLDRQ
jgi:glutaredoxin